MGDDFAERAQRIRKARGNDVLTRAERGRGPRRLRPFWLLLGTICGIVASVHVKQINTHYDSFKALAATDPAFASEFSMRTIGAMGTFVVLAALVVIGLLFARRAWGLWNFCVGIGVIGIALGSYLSTALAPLLMGPKFFP